MFRTAFVAFLLVLTAACAQLPRAEFQAYRESFQAAQTAAAPINADYAVTERAARLRVLQRTPVRGEDGRPLKVNDRIVTRYSGENPFFRTFEVDDATAISTIGLPPGAAAVDRAFRAIASYNEALIALAENRNIDEAKGQLRQIVNDVGGILPVEPSALAVASAFTDVIGRVLQPAIEAGNRELFKERILDGYQPMINIVDLLRTHSQDQYMAIINPLLTRLEGGAAGADRDELIKKINAWQRVFADYVVLLNAVKARLTDLRDAILHPRQASVLARASAGAAQLRGYAEGLRTSIDALRALP